MKRRLLIGLAAMVLVAGVGISHARAANLFAGNGVYQVAVSDGAQFWKCGVWTAATGPTHPAGPGLPLLGAVNDLFPLDSSFTTLRSFHTNLSYTTNDLCSPLCLVAGLPLIEPITRDGVIVGYRLSWVFRDQLPSAGIFGATVRFVQEVAVEGPVDGTQTVDNSVVRETHIIENLGPGGFRFGLRKLWDLLIGSDWGPSVGSCENPTVACDRSLDLGKSGLVAYPRNLAITPSPEAASCPGGFLPDEPAGCGGNPAYVVAATVKPPTGLFPRPHPPQLVQFNYWNLAYNCWLTGLQDAADCGDDGLNSGTALLYYWGVTLDTAIRLWPGQSKSYTQYLGAGTEGCPGAITADHPDRTPGAHD